MYPLAGNNLHYIEICNMTCMKLETEYNLKHNSKLHNNLLKVLTKCFLRSEEKEMACEEG